MMSAAAAPSLTCEELPAVMHPSSTKADRNRASDSAVLPDALVVAHRGAGHENLAGIGVDSALGDGADFSGEPSGIPSGRRELMTAHGVPVERRAVPAQIRDCNSRARPAGSL
jgi:hypothetical protein